MTTTAITPEIVDPALAELPAPVERVGGLNENRVDPLDSLYSRIEGLDREDYASPVNRLRVSSTDQGLRLGVPGTDFTWRATEYALGQLSTRLAPGLSTFGADLRTRGYADIFAGAVNGLLEQEEYDGKRFQLRTIQPSGERITRAVVSPSYKPIDDDLIVPTMLSRIKDSSGAWRALGGQITDRRTHIRFINREPSLRNIGPNGRDWFMGFEYSNSEVAQGSCLFSLFFYDSYCENGCIFGKESICNVNFRHVGAEIKTGFGLVLDERMREVEQAKIQRLILSATDQALSGDFTAKVRESMEQADSRKLLPGNQVEQIKQIGKSIGLTQNEQESVLAHWDSREDSLLGVHSAITRLAQDAPTFEKRVELEKAGGQALDLNAKAWNAIAALSA